MALADILVTSPLSSSSIWSPAWSPELNATLSFSTEVTKQGPSPAISNPKCLGHLMLRRKNMAIL